jgi:hypothetical protein
MSGAQPRRHVVVEVTSSYPPRLGGVEIVAQTIAELLAERHDMHVITTTGFRSLIHRFLLVWHCGC